MANTWFQFKQFTIQQQQSAMKVTTDGCLFGAWAAQHLQSRSDIKTVLDIGAGTGLLSLMLAQKLADTKIIGVEIEKGAAAEAQQNLAASTFAEQVEIVQQDILTYAPAISFDAIVTNPPFYEKQLSSPQADKNVAHHAGGLTLGPLFTACHHLTKPDGILALLLPYYRKDEALQMAENAGWYASAIADVQQTTNHGYFRTMMWLQKTKMPLKTAQWAIKDDTGNYTAEFTQLLKDYYLHL